MTLIFDANDSQKNAFQVATGVIAHASKPEVPTPFVNQGGRYPGAFGYIRAQAQEYKAQSGSEAPWDFAIVAVPE